MLYFFKKRKNREFHVIKIGVWVYTIDEVIIEEGTMNNFENHSILNSLFEGIYIVDKHRKIIFWSKGAERITGFTDHETVGKFSHDNILNHIDIHGRQLCFEGFDLSQPMIDGQPREVDLYIQHKMGYMIPVKMKIIPWIIGGKVEGTIEMFIESHESIHTIKRIGSISNKLLRDKLTGLPNKKRFEHFLVEKMNDYRNLDVPFGLILADIDNFEGINDTYGRESGDELLRLLSDTFRNSIKLADMIGRWENDAFIFLFSDVSNEAIYLLCEKIRVLSEGSTLRNSAFKDVDFTVSVGGTVIRNEDDINQIVERLYARLKKAKIRGGNNSVVK